MNDKKFIWHFVASQRCIKYGSAIFLTTLLMFSASAEEGYSFRASASSDKLINVGGHVLNFRYRLGTLPAIVFESAGDLDSTQWNEIQDALSAQLPNAIVSYDRSGRGKSELSQDAYDINSVAAALHEGLKQLAIHDKVILVAHSYGGLIAQVYAARYTSTVDHIIFVDPNTVFFTDAVGGATALAQRDLKFYAEDISLVKQLSAFPATIEMVRNLPSINISCTVISSEENWGPNNAWRTGHKLLADACDSPLIVAKGSDHMIPSSAPDFIIDSVKSLVWKKERRQ